MAIHSTDRVGAVSRAIHRVWESTKRSRPGRIGRCSNVKSTRRLDRGAVATEIRIRVSTRVR
jgi:hypothetical protein